MLRIGNISGTADISSSALGYLSHFYLISSTFMPSEEATTTVTWGFGTITESGILLLSGGVDGIHRLPILWPLLKDQKYIGCSICITSSCKRERTFTTLYADAEVT